MNIIYTGSGDLAYRSAPSAFRYIFSAGVPQKVKPEDEEFFETMASNPNNPWRVEGAAEVVAKTAADAVVGAVDSMANRFGKKRKGG